MYVIQASFVIVAFRLCFQGVGRGVGILLDEQGGRIFEAEGIEAVEAARGSV